MRILELIEDDIYAIKSLIQDAIRYDDQKELEALYSDLDELTEELWNAKTTTI